MLWLRWVFLQQNRRVEEDDGWQRYADGAPEEADGAYRLVMLWLVALTFVYARRTCRLLGRYFASEHKARRKKPAVVRGTRTAFGLVQVLVVLLLYICGVGAGMPTGHCFGGGPGLAYPPNLGEGSTHLTERSEEHSPSTDTGHTAQIRRGTSQRFKLDGWHSSILALQYFGTADSARTYTRDDGPVSRDDSDFEQSSLVNMGRSTRVRREVLQHFEFDDWCLSKDIRLTATIPSDFVEYLGALELPRATTCSITDAHCGILASVHGALAFGGPCGTAGEHPTIRTASARKRYTTTCDSALRDALAGWSAAPAPALMRGEKIGSWWRCPRGEGGKEGTHTPASSMRWTWFW